MSMISELGEAAKDFNKGYNIGKAAIKLKSLAMGETLFGTDAVAGDMKTEVSSEVIAETTIEMASEGTSEVIAEEGANIFIEALSFLLE